MYYIVQLDLKNLKEAPTNYESLSATEGQERKFAFAWSYDLDKGCILSHSILVKNTHRVNIGSSNKVWIGDWTVLIEEKYNPRADGLGY